MQLQRQLGCEYNTAWFLHHRVMEAMRRGGLDLPPMGGAGQSRRSRRNLFRPVPRPDRRKAPGGGRTRRAASSVAGKRAIIALVERGGNVRSFHVPTADRRRSPRSCVRTSHAKAVCTPTKASCTSASGREFAAHETVNHSRKNMRAAT